MPWHGGFFMRNWRRKEKFSGGFMLEKCCHDLDFYNMIVGCRPKKVASFRGRNSFIPKNTPSHNLDEFSKYNSFGWESKSKVFDSDAENEFQETVNKSKALIKAAEDSIHFFGD